MHLIKQLFNDEDDRTIGLTIIRIRYKNTIRVQWHSKDWRGWHRESGGSTMTATNLFSEDGRPMTVNSP